MVEIIIKILLVAVTIAFLGGWGIVKQQRKNHELLEKLYKKTEKKIISTLKIHEKLTIKEVEEIIKGTKASLFWSKQKIVVKDPKIISKDILSKMIEKDLIIEKYHKGKKIIILK